jgi:ABC-type cobalamin transport system permease subunit
MSDGPRQRRPIKVVLMVAAFWIGGTVLQSALAWLLSNSGVVGDDSAGTIGLILGWGILFLGSLYYRQPLDAWLRT